MHFIVRSIFRLLFPLKLSDAQKEIALQRVQSKFGLKEFLIAFGVLILLIPFTMSVGGGIMRLLNMVLAPTESNGSYFYRSTNAIESFIVSIPFAYYGYIFIMKRLYKQNYEDLKLYFSLTNNFDAIKSIKFVVFIGFFFFLFIAYLISGDKVSFSEDRIVSSHLNIDTNGDKIDSVYSYPYSDIESITYIPKSRSTLNINMKNGDVIEMKRPNDYDEDFNPKLLTRLLEKTRLKIDTIGDE
ncbi:MAG: hypothetical protein JNL95_05500 [Chitinophagales bacterium]|nr:hypothetical protein [Chitinophagales bacterium]